MLSVQTVTLLLKKLTRRCLNLKIIKPIIYTDIQLLELESKEMIMVSGQRFSGENDHHVSFFSHATWHVGS